MLATAVAYRTAVPVRPMARRPSTIVPVHVSALAAIAEGS